MTLTQKPTRQVRRALAHQSPTVSTQRLTEEIQNTEAAAHNLIPLGIGG